MPLYEYYCEPCNGIFEAIRPMREASLAVPCPECDSEGQRIMSAFTAFTFRDGYPRRIPDKGTYWHMGKEVKKRAKRMKGWTHPELAERKPPPRPTRGEARAGQEKRISERRDLRYRDKWGIDKDGFPTMKTRVKEKEKKVLPAG
jgi:putative FmdB family regulatory protein